MHERMNFYGFLLPCDNKEKKRELYIYIYIYNLIYSLYSWLLLCIHLFSNESHHLFLIVIIQYKERTKKFIHVGECINEWIDFNVSAICCKTYYSKLILRSIKI
jgi:hypothetical protein